MCESQNQSWLDMLDSSNSSFEASENENNKSKDNGKREREIEIEIFDSKNEKKFDKLVSEKKIKSPFKRRHSNEKLNDGGDEEKTEKKMRKDFAEEEEEEEQAPSKSGSKKGDVKSARQKFRSDSTSASDSSSTYSSNCNLASLHRPKDFETDQPTLDRRQKQIDYGKNTIGYANYIQQVPKDKRTREHPKTPPRHIQYSRRAWEGLIKAWRKKLHAYDDGAEADDE